MILKKHFNMSNKLIVTRLILICFAFIFLTIINSFQSSEATNLTGCSYKGKFLGGNVKVVDFLADYNVKVVDFLPDLYVKRTDFFATQCGEWKFVDFVPDFTIKFVDFLPDFTIKFVDFLPGLPYQSGSNSGNIIPPTIQIPNETTAQNSGNICLKITSQTKECFSNTNMSWTYNLCWSTIASKVNLEKWNKKKKKFEKVKTIKIKKSPDCEKDYPKLVKFTITETDTKSKTYRVRFIGDSGGEEEKIKVTFE